MSFEKRKSDLVNSLAKEAEARVGPKDGPSAARFVRDYFGLVGPEDMVYASPETLLGGALSLWEFGRDRAPGTARVRLFNPTRDVHGWELAHTVLEVVNDDMPFLVDSIVAEFSQTDRNLHLLIHPVVGVTRNSEHHRIGTGEGEAAPLDAVLLNESYMHIELDQETSQSDLDAIRGRLENVLEKVRVTVNDWQAMRRRMLGVIEGLRDQKLDLPADQIDETEELLRWLYDGNFVFLGARHYQFATIDGRDYLKPEPGTGLGILRELRQESIDRGNVPFHSEFSLFARRPDPLIITKANSHSLVHRRALMDRISIKEFDDDGQLVGETRFLGLFTRAAYKRSVFEIPLLRRRAKRVIERSGLGPASHDGKALVQIVETIPRDETLQISEDELFELSVGILQIHERRRIELFVRMEVFERYMSCLLFVPRNRWDSKLQERSGAILEEAFSGKVIEVNAEISDSPLARAHFIVKTTPGHVPEVDLQRLEAQLTEASRTWSDHLLDALTRNFGEEKGLDIHRRYVNAFPSAYQERFSAEAAVEDIALIEKVLSTGELAVELYHRDLYYSEAEERASVGCIILHSGASFALSDLMPRLENLGLRVRLEVPYVVKPAGTQAVVRIRDFALDWAGVGVDPVTLNRSFQETFDRVWKGEMEDDGFNRLVLLAEIEWYQVVVLRAYARFLRQASVSARETSIQRALSNNPAIAQLLVQLFEAMFDPALNDEERKRVSSIRESIDDELEAVSNADEDRILRSYLNAIESTLRTNYFQRDSDGKRKPYLSFKVDSLAIDDLPAPRPMFEIFVYSPAVEGIHLRAGMVARGGIRWSDRQEDFRTEILGLMKAQNVKNTVIVPVGAKGGFIVKRPMTNASREEFQAQGIACYKTLIRGLLDLTDNLDGSTVVPPRDVVRRDGNDFYLVVAADKGTATFSDIANGIAAEYGFWLGDAFASGGSAGYDHKRMGITAKGAWEAVKRHFRELGTDIQNEDFTTVGVGDMSGDVFGNGMLLSRHTRLLGAFNHLHIFVDPDPDPETSFVERERLFALPRSSWSDYDPSVLSPGGAVFERKSKSITISEEVRERFDLPSKVLTPSSLIQAILRARADLLFLGGIGTYVKSSDESHAAVRDRANDALRVSADELRVRVVGEGANLGFTQSARIEFALTGGTGKINSDAIDNSAGVDTSDHEVNIKILVDEAVRRGQLAPADRLALLVEMTDEVSTLVLEDNYQQTEAISIACAQGEPVLDSHTRLMKLLERQGRLDRALEGLPDDETIAERHTAQLGLTRPEVSVLLAYSKLWLYQEVLDSTVVDEPILVTDLVRYFPKALKERFRGLIEEHRLRRELVATFISNNLVNRVGPTFVSMIVEETGMSPADVARAYLIARDALGLHSLFVEMSTLDTVVTADEKMRKMTQIARVIERTTLWLLRRRTESLDLARQVGTLRPRVRTISDEIDEILPPSEAVVLQARIADNVTAGFPQAVARRLAILPVIASSFDIIHIAGETLVLEDVARVYFAVGLRLDLDRFRSSAGALVAKTPWQKAAIDAVVDDYFSYQSVITRRVVQETKGGAPEETIQSWLCKRGSLVGRVDQLIGEFRAAPKIDMSMLTVLARQLRFLAES